MAPTEPMTGFTVTYDIVTPESAEQGDNAESGFCLPGGWTATAEEGCADRASVELTLREALKLVGCGLYDNGSWFRGYPEIRDYSTCAEESRSLHPPRNITRASYARLKRLLKVK